MQSVSVVLDLHNQTQFIFLFKQHKCVSVVLVTYKPVSDLEADHAQQQEGREEGVEENKV